MSLSKAHYSTLCISPLMNPHLISLETDFYLDLHQIAHIHKYQSHKQINDILKKGPSNIFKESEKLK